MPDNAQRAGLDDSILSLAEADRRLASGSEFPADDPPAAAAGVAGVREALTPT